MDFNQMRHISLKNRVRVVALAMIAFPEPVSTILGIVILGATLAVWRQKSLNKFGDAEVLIKRSLLNTRTESFSRYFNGEHAVVNHMLKTSLFLQPQESLRTSKQTLANPQGCSWFDNRKISETVLHHTLKTSFPQYEAVPGVLQKSNLKAGTEQDVQHHKLKLSLIPETNTSLY
jgi:hypothetical protein